MYKKRKKVILYSDYSKEFVIFAPYLSIILSQPAICSSSILARLFPTTLNTLNTPNIPII